MGVLVRTAMKMERAAAEAPVLLRRLVAGYYRLPRQRDLLRSSNWNVLLILDACRADYFRRLGLSGVRTVRSMGPCTRAWILELAGLLGRGHEEPTALWFTANPLVNRDCRLFGVKGVRLVSVWQTRWGRHGRAAIPSVHPDAVNEEVRSYLREHGQPSRMLVHYIQPHFPCIGRTELALAQWGELSDELSRQARGLQSPAQAVAAGDVSVGRIRKAYADNLRLVWDSARRLVPSLRGKVVVTSDHGELLGEGGLFGHECGWTTELLRCVPWVELDNGPFEPRPVPPAADEPVLEGVMHRRLRSLGYV